MKKKKWIYFLSHHLRAEIKKWADIKTQSVPTEVRGSRVFVFTESFFADSFMRFMRHSVQFKILRSSRRGVIGSTQVCK